MYDLSMGLPRLYNFTQISIDGIIQSIYEYPTQRGDKALAFIMTAAQSITGLSGVTKSTLNTTGDYRVAVYLQAWSGAANHSLMLGFTDGTKFTVMEFTDNGANPTWYINQYNNKNSYSNRNAEGAQSFPPRELWLGVGIRTIAGVPTAFYDISVDGVAWQALYSETLTKINSSLPAYGSNLQGPWLASYASIFVGHNVSGGQATFTQLSIRCYDENGIGRNYPSANPPDGYPDSY
jgi:hypothetical protein